jgi:hypothetical protein
LTEKIPGVTVQQIAVTLCDSSAFAMQALGWRQDSNVHLASNAIQQEWHVIKRHKIPDLRRSSLCVACL